MDLIFALVRGFEDNSNPSNLFMMKKILLKFLIVYPILTCLKFIINRNLFFKYYNKIPY